jgi:signal transduction histidine kinase
LFQPFFKSTDPKSLEINRNGHGLGLSICNKIVKAMGGTLEVKSHLGAGSNFTLKLKTKFSEGNAV